MKKIVHILAIALVLTVIGSTLYIFDLPPFKKAAVQPDTTADETKIQEEQNLPAALQEQKIGRAKTFAEHMQRAALLEQNNFPTLAIAEYQSASKLEPTNLEPLMNIGKIYLRINDFPKAQEMLESIQKKNPEHTETKIYLGRAYLGQRKISEAQKTFDSISTASQSSKYYQGITAAYFGDYERSKRLLNEAAGMEGEDLKKKANNFLSAFNEFDFNSESPKTHLKTLLARSYNQTGEYQMAIPLLFEVIKEKKDYRDAWILLGYAYININKYQDAIDALEEAKKLDPQHAQTLFFLGLSYYSMNDYKKALSNLELAKSNGYEPKIQVDQKLAEIYLLLNQFEKSAEHYERAITLNDADVNYYTRPIWIYIEKINKPKNAVALAEKAVKNHPKEAMSYNLLGWALIYNQKFSEAESNLKKAMALNPKLDATYLNYGILMEKKGHIEEAINFYKKAHQMGQGNGIGNVAAANYNKLTTQLKNQSVMTNTLSN